MMIFTSILSKHFLRKISPPLIAYFIFAITILPLYSKLNESKNPLDLNTLNNSVLESSEFVVSIKLVERNFERLTSNQKIDHNYNYFYLNELENKSNKLNFMSIFGAPKTQNNLTTLPSKSIPRSPPIILI